MKTALFITVLFLYPLLFVLPVSAFEEHLQGIKDSLYDTYEIDYYGFVEMRSGWRMQEDPYEKDATLAEIRLQTDLAKSFDWVELKLKFDILGDMVTEEANVDLRELHLSFSPFDIMDVKLGRQVLTWGTGDLLFVNDLFPKDWISFFIGRDTEYLKSPSDAVRINIFFDFVNVDLAYIPEFCGSEYIDGSRLSYWNSMLGRTAGRDFVFDDQYPNDLGTDDEFSIRLSKNLNSVELAFYGYHGFWKTPEGVNTVVTKLVYPKLSVLGGSVRGALFGGIGSTEMGYYYTSDDSSGKNPVIRNSEIRFLTGFEKELARDFTGGIQYYLEYMQDYDEYEQYITAGMRKKDEYRHVLTLRLTKMLMNQNLKLSFFTYYSPSDADYYMRPNIHYKINDQWAAEIGGNIFLGDNDHTFFAQFKENTNAYASLRISF